MSSQLSRSRSTGTVRRAATPGVAPLRPLAPPGTEDAPSAPADSQGVSSCWWKVKSSMARLSARSRERMARGSGEWVIEILKKDRQGEMDGEEQRGKR